MDTNSHNKRYVINKIDKLKIDQSQGQTALKPSRTLKELEYEIVEFFIKILNFSSTSASVNKV